MTYDFFPPGKAAVLIDGQFGSTGKGLLAAYLARTAKHEPDVVTTNASANAGHTTILEDGEKMVLHHLPTAGVLTRAEIYINAGAVIEPVVFGLEASIWDRRFQVIDRLLIHPRAAVIESEDLKSTSIGISGGTGHGVSGAIARNVKRTSPLIVSQMNLRPHIGTMDLNLLLSGGSRVFVETPQGLGLSLNGPFYPHCTSRVISVAQSLSDAGIHPAFIGPVFLSLRAHPIRVGNVDLGEGVHASSGGWHSDQYEMNWSDLNVQPETTTVTKRPRRIASFSHSQAKAALIATRPHFIFLNFVQYQPDASLSIARWLQATAESLGLGRVPVWAGIGPRHDQDIFEDIDTALTEVKRRG